MFVDVRGMLSVAQSASIEALFSEINKLPAPQRQKRLEDGARKEGAFKFYGISNAALLDAYYRRFHANDIRSLKLSSGAAAATSWCFAH